MTEDAAVATNRAVPGAPRRNAWAAARAIFSGLAGVLLGLSLSAAVFLFFATRFLNWNVVTVETGSMEPRIKVGDIAVSRPVSMDTVKAGDIIYFREPNTGVPFVHRVLGINTITTTARDPQGNFVGQTTEFRYRTKGDANASPDPYEITAAQFGGRVWFTIPTYGLLNGQVSLQLMLLIAAGVFGVIWVSWEFFAIGRSTGKKQRRRRRKRLSPAPTEAPSTETGPD